MNNRSSQAELLHTPAQQAYIAPLVAVSESQRGNHIAKDMLHAHHQFVQRLTEYTETQQQLDREMRQFFSLVSMFQTLDAQEIAQHSNLVNTLNTNSSPEAKAFALNTTGSSKKELNIQELKHLHQEIDWLTKLLEQRAHRWYDELSTALQQKLATLDAKTQPVIFYAFLHFHDQHNQGIKARIENIIIHLTTLQHLEDTKTSLAHTYEKVHTHLQSQVTQKKSSSQKLLQQNELANTAPLRSLEDQRTEIAQAMQHTPALQWPINNHLQKILPWVVRENALSIMQTIEESGTTEQQKLLYTTIIEAQKTIGNMDPHLETVWLVNMMINQHNIDRLEEEITEIEILAQQLLPVSAYVALLDETMPDHVRKQSIGEHTQRVLHQLFAKVTPSALTRISLKTKQRLRLALLLVAGFGATKYYLNDPQGVFEWLGIHADDIRDYITAHGSAYDTPENIRDTLDLTTLPSVKYRIQKVDPVVNDSEVRERLTCELLADGNKIFTSVDQANYASILEESTYKKIYESIVQKNTVTEREAFVIFLYFYAQERSKEEQGRTDEYYASILNITGESKQLPIRFPDPKYDKPLLLWIALQMLINEEQGDPEKKLIRLQNIATAEQKSAVVKKLISTYPTIVKALWKISQSPIVTQHTKEKIEELVMAG